MEARLSGTSGSMEISVWRGTGGGGAYQTYAVPEQENQTVLDVVSWIQQFADPTLSYRFACRVGMCGSCAMMVNDTPRWTCRTHVRKVLRNHKLRLSPLRNLPVIKDLATDMDPFFDKWTTAEGRHHPTRSRSDPIAEISPTSPGRVVADAGIECINCAVCYAACDTVANAPGYLGPAALNRAWTVFNDARDATARTVPESVSGHDGCHNCHSIGSCTALCPNDLDPLGAIAGLKRETTKSFFRRRRNA